MTYETTLRRKHDKSLAADTKVLLDEGTKRWLHISTSKHSRGGLSCTASVHVHKDGSIVHVIGFGGPGGDFWRTVEYDQQARCTEKNVRAIHQRALDRIGDILALARAHYGLDEKVEG